MIQFLRKSARNIIISDSTQERLNTLRIISTEVACFPSSTLRKLRSRARWRSKAAALVTSPGGLRIHLGCGDRHFDGMLNCEFRATKAADLVMDCANLKRFRNESVSLIFSHAFFEHLFVKQHAPFMRNFYRILAPDGLLVFIGLPDFEVISEAYLKKVPLNLATDHLASYGSFFGLYHVYRYSHGAPENAPLYWLQQLHKSLIDKAFLDELLRKAGFTDFAVFNYVYPKERIPLCVGFVARKPSRGSQTELRSMLPSILTPFSEYFSSINELVIAPKIDQI